jgi:NAD(P)H-quinone oxidoreductase subunit 5
MMIHKKNWDQAFQSGMLALRNFTIGAICLMFAMLILYFETGSYSIREILEDDFISQKSIIASSILIVIAALTQCALYPFHSWLTSSLNSPTPASAIMHAGLVNGGGILLARFAPIILELPNLMVVIFVIGIFSAIFGTLLKLVQGNVKGMLACSTMSQMGFMIAQCGMGLFPAAIAHLFWHGMFKSYLFLSSPGSWQEKRFDLQYPPKFPSFFLSLLCGFSGAFIFAKTNGVEFHKFDTTLILVSVAFIAASQVSLTIIDKFPLKNIVPAIVISSLLSFVYGLSVTFVENIMSPEIFQPQKINIGHISATLAMLFFWVARLFMQKSTKEINPIFLKGYVKILNAGQPDSKTITNNRNQYTYR